MSDASPATSGWTAPRVRRVRMFATLLVACAVLAVVTASQPWFAWATPGVAPGCDPVPAGAPTISVQMPDRSWVEGVAARGCLTGTDLSATYTSPVGTAAGVAAAHVSLPNHYVVSGPAQMLGMPRVMVVLVACSALAAYAAMSRRGWLGGLTLFFLQLPHRDLAAVRAQFLGDAGSPLTVDMPGLAWFTWCLLGASLLVLTSTLFVLKVNFEDRAVRRRLAREQGLEDPAEPLDPLTDYLGRKIRKVKASAAAGQREEMTRTDASAPLP